MDKIKINNMRFWGYNGILSEEQRLGQPLSIDLELQLDLTEAAICDSLEKTINYAEVLTKFQKIIETERFQLIESLAYRLLDVIEKNFKEKLSCAIVKIRKLYVPMNGIFDNIEIEMERKFK